jgi:methyl-accepting chemotaxis protein
MRTILSLQGIKRMSLNLKQQGLVATVGISIVLLGFIGLTLFNEYKSYQVEKKLEVEISLVAETLLPLSDKISRIKFDVVQVQQWLTDISATRGLDGLDDGPEVARTFAEKFKKDTEEALRLANSAGLTKVASSIKEIQSIFPDFYATGKKMAHAYVDGGPAAGNLMMSAFDEVAEKTSIAMEHSEKEILVAIAAMQKDRQVIAMESKNLRKWSLIFSTLMFVLAIVSVLLIVKGVMRTLNSMILVAGKMQIATDGKLNERMQDSDLQDEIGELQRSFNNLLEMTSCFVDDAGRCMATLEQGRYDEKINTVGLTGDFAVAAGKINQAVDAMGNKNSAFSSAGQSFESGVKENYGTISQSMEALTQASHVLLSLTENSAHEADIVAEASSSSSQGVQAVATATEELSASIQEIGRQVSNSAQLVDESSAEARNATEQINALSEASEKIGDVVEMITGIAEQTNLLALNATIESARAGEAGKGFAVVAQEVKALAAQTGTATDEVRAQVDTIQNRTRDAVRVIEAVSNRMNQVNDAVTAIAAAVEQQGAATNEISSSIDTVATQSTRVSESVTLLHSAIKQTQESANEMNTSTETVHVVSGRVSEDIDDFMETMKSVTG